MTRIKNPHHLWSWLSRSLSRSSIPDLPTEPPLSVTDYMAYMHDKVALCCSPSLQKDCQLLYWPSFSAEDLCCQLMELPELDTLLDTLLPFLIKNLVDDLLPFLHLLCCTSVGEGILHSSQKRAIVLRSQQHSVPDPVIMANYSPISNLSYQSKMVSRKS